MVVGYAVAAMHAIAKGQKFPTNESFDDTPSSSQMSASRPLANRLVIVVNGSFAPMTANYVHQNERQNYGERVGEPIPYVTVAMQNGYRLANFDQRAEK